MGLMDWFKGVAAGKPATGVDASVTAEGGATPAPEADSADDREGGVVAGLNFKTAIDAHMKWKVRLERCVENDNEEGLHADTVSRDDQCVLGKWIHGVGGERFGHLRAFQEMKMEHARFHLSAGDVVTCCLAGDKDGATQRLRTGDYTRASEKVKLHLARLYVELTANADNK